MGNCVIIANKMAVDREQKISRKMVHNYVRETDVRMLMSIGAGKGLLNGPPIKAPPYVKWACKRGPPIRASN